MMRALKIKPKTRKNQNAGFATQWPFLNKFSLRRLYHTRLLKETLQILLHCTAQCFPTDAFSLQKSQESSALQMEVEIVTKQEYTESVKAVGKR